MGFVWSQDVRYLEVDSQGVVFNMWYLAYLDEAMTAYLADRGLHYPELVRSGVDVQLVHTELDWSGPLHHGERVDVEVETQRLGRTSFTLGFTVSTGGRAVATASTVYVVVGTDGSGKRRLDQPMRAALAPR